MILNILNQSSHAWEKHIQLQGLQLALTALSEHFSKAFGDINVVLVSPSMIQQLNNTHLSHDYVTDILTFDLGADQAQQTTADIVICGEVAEENAALYGVSLSSELHRLVIHGCLHLCGINDSSKSEKAEMRALEEKYLKLFNL